MLNGDEDNFPEKEISKQIWVKFNIRWKIFLFNSQHWAADFRRGFLSNEDEEPYKRPTGVTILDNIVSVINCAILYYWWISKEDEYVVFWTFERFRLKHFQLFEWLSVIW